MTTITGDPDDPARSPRVDRVWAQQQIDTYGRENPWCRVNVLGLFPEQSLNALLGPEDLSAAMQRHLPADAYEWAQKRIGVDVARYGLDRTVLFPRQGRVAFPPVVLRHARGSAVSVEIANRVLAAKAKWGSELELFDATGGWAAGAVDVLRAQGFAPLDVQFAPPALDPRYKNRRAELWMAMAEWVKGGGSLSTVPEPCGDDHGARAGSNGRSGAAGAEAPGVRRRRDRRPCARPFSCCRRGRYGIGRRGAVSALLPRHERVWRGGVEEVPVGSDAASFLSCRSAPVDASRVEACPTGGLQRSREPARPGGRRAGGRAGVGASGGSRVCRRGPRPGQGVLMTHVATYARYSSDQQRRASIADQQRLCHEFAARQGWTVVADYTDAAMSGASLLRPGFQALVHAALERRFDVVLAESLDRFSRDQEHTAGLFKRLTFADVRIVTVSEGDIGHLRPEGHDECPVSS